MKLRSISLPRFCPSQYGFVLFAAALAISLLSLHADEIESEEPSPIAVLTQTVESDAAQICRRYPARIRAVEQVDVVSRLSADIVEVGFTEGGMVRKGQLLYRLDDTRFVAAVSNQVAQIAEIKAKLELANLAFARKGKLIEKGLAPQAEFDAAYAAKLELEANLEAAKAALVLAEDGLRHARIVSPIDGKIGLTTKTVGNYITPESGVLATIVKTDPLRVRFSLSMVDYARLFGCSEERLKSEADILIDAPPGMTPFPRGVIEFVDLKAVERTDTVLVYVRQPNPDGRLVPESAATLVLSVAAQGVLPWVPPQALIEDGDESFVYVVEDGKAILRAVEESGRLPDRVFVKVGLKAGETVIVGGTHKVSDGAAVTCKEVK
jgi:RND family efflux transporter MFP subunit